MLSYIHKEKEMKLWVLHGSYEGESFTSIHLTEKVVRWRVSLMCLSSWALIMKRSLGG